MNKKTIAIDFDYVIHRYSQGWGEGPIYDPPMPGAIKAITQLKKKYKIVIFTARFNLPEIKLWILEHFSGWSPEITNVKPQAFIYIKDYTFFGFRPHLSENITLTVDSDDDRAIRFTSWQDTLKKK